MLVIERHNAVVVVPVSSSDERYSGVRRAVCVCAWCGWCGWCGWHESGIGVAGRGGRGILV